MPLIPNKTRLTNKGTERITQAEYDTLMANNELVAGRTYIIEDIEFYTKPETDALLKPIQDALDWDKYNS